MQKNFWQYSTPVYDKLSRKWTYRQYGHRTCFNIIKAIYDKVTANITVNDEKLKAFHLWLGSKQGYLSLPLLFNIVLEVLATATRKKRRRRRNSHWKGRNKIVIVTMHMSWYYTYIENPKDPKGMILYTENPKDTNKLLLQGAK